MKILKEGKLTEASRVEYSDLIEKFPMYEDAIATLQHGYFDLINQTNLRLLPHLDEHIDRTLNMVAGSLIVGEDKYKIIVEKFNTELQNEAKRITDAAKKLEKLTSTATKLFEKLSKEIKNGEQDM